MKRQIEAFSDDKVWQAAASSIESGKEEKVYGREFSSRTMQSIFMKLARRIELNWCLPRLPKCTAESHYGC